ncbi:adenosylcobinamide-GDP ribazoletransferase [Bacillus sp. 165]|nr:adenosylcobinamide-GDP ribazoletransferase [Bacillus sp. 165]
MYYGIILSFQLLTILPIRLEVPWSKKYAKAAVYSFPLTGVLLGILLILQYDIFVHYTSVSRLFVSLWLIFFTILYSGGLHIDGWMDISDAIASHRNRDKKLEILKDSRVGAFAVLSLFFLLAFRFLFVYEVLADSAFFHASYLVSIPILIRIGMVLLLIWTPPASQAGMAYAFKQHMTVGDSSFMLFYGAGLLFMLYLYASLPVFWMSVCLIGAMLVFVSLFRDVCKKQFGGITGDMLGAVIEGCETLLWFVLWLLHFFVTA